MPLFKLIPIPHWGVFLTRSTMNPFAVSTEQGQGSPKLMTLFLLVFAKTQKSYFWYFFRKNLKFWTSKFFGGPRALGKNGKILKNFFLKKTQNLKSLGSKGLTHKFWVKSETIFFFISKGGPFDVFPIFEVLIHRQWSTLTDRNGGSDFFDC